MKLTVDALSRHLNQSLLPVYLVSGDELLVAQESVDQIRRQAMANGFTERAVFHVEGRFDWGLFTDESAALSLFAEKKILELRFKKSSSARTFKPGKEACAQIENYLAHMDEHNILIIEMPRIDPGELKKKWYQKLESTGAVLTLWPVELTQFPSWIKQRSAAMGLQLDPDASQFIAEKVEGNLLAAAQELEKLKFQHASEKITLEDVMNAVSESSRYRTFDLTEACLKKDLRRAYHIMNGLISEGVQLLLILGAINRTLQQIIKIGQLRKRGLPADQACYKSGVTNRKQHGLYVQYAQQLSRHTATDLLDLAFEVDRAIKGNSKLPPQEQLGQLLVKMCTPR